MADAEDTLTLDLWTLELQHNKSQWFKPLSV